MPGHRRPVVIIQADAFNHSRINTVLVAVITSNVQLAQAPGNVLLATKRSGLPRESVINVSQIITVDKSFLTEQVGSLTSRQMHQLENGLRSVLSL
jgi:mRNA interferase MazF